jgi:hypothetical protein
MTMKQFKRDQPTFLLVSEVMNITLLQTGLQNPVQKWLGEQNMVTVKGNMERKACSQCMLLNQQQSRSCVDDLKAHLNGWGIYL